MSSRSGSHPFPTDDGFGSGADETTPAHVGIPIGDYQPEVALPLDAWGRPWMVSFSISAPAKVGKAATGATVAVGLPKDVAAMVMHMLHTRMVTDAVSWLVAGCRNSALHHPNWWRSVKFSRAALQGRQLRFVAAAMPRLRRLECEPALQGQAADLAAACASLRFLTEVRLDALGSDMAGPELAAVAAGLKSLHVASCEALSDISALYSCGQLRHVTLQNSGLTSDGLAAFALLPQLETLDLSHSAQVTSLCRLAQCQALSRLVLNQTGVTALCEPHTCGCDLSGLVSLTNLSLEACEQLSNVNGALRCRGLQALNFSWSQGIRSLEGVVTLTSLTDLRVAGLRCVTTDTMSALTKLPIRTLHVQSCVNLHQLHPMPSLRHLRATFGFTLEQLRRSKYPSLESYTLVGYQASPDAIPALNGASHSLFVAEPMSIQSQVLSSVGLGLFGLGAFAGLVYFIMFLTAHFS